MVTRLTRIAPVQLAIVAAALYAILGLLVGVAVALAAFAGRSVPATSTAGVPTFGMGWLSIILFPIIYAALGFIGGLIYAWLYNLIAGWTGGVEITLESRQPVNTV
jgi:hypothetical protein